MFRIVCSPLAVPWSDRGLWTYTRPSGHPLSKPSIWVEAWSRRAVEGLCYSRHCGPARLSTQLTVKEMASIRREILTRAKPGDVWSALRDVGSLHTRLVPGFVTDTRLEPGARVVTFGNGMVVRELIVTVDEAEHRIVWSAVGGSLTHHNGSAQVFSDVGGFTKVVWIADLLPDEAAGLISTMMDEGMRVMKQTLDRLGDER